MKKVSLIIFSFLLYFNCAGQIFSVDELATTVDNNDFPKSFISLCTSKGFVVKDMGETPYFNSSLSKKDVAFSKLLTKYDNGEQSMMITINYSEDSKSLSIMYLDDKAGYKFNLSEIAKEYSLVKSIKSYNNTPEYPWRGYTVDVYQYKSLLKYFVVYHAPPSKVASPRIEYMDMESFKEFCAQF